MLNDDFSLLGEEDGEARNLSSVTKGSRPHSGWRAMPKLATMLLSAEM